MSFQIISDPSNSQWQSWQGSNSGRKSTYEPLVAATAELLDKGEGRILVPDLEENAYSAARRKIKLSFEKQYASGRLKLEKGKNGKENVVALKIQVV